MRLPDGLFVTSNLKPTMNLSSSGHGPATVEEMGLYSVQGGKIVREEYFYQTGA